MQIDNYHSDMQILPETAQENAAIIKWAKLKGYHGTINFVSYVSNLKGQDWFGKRFYEIPFAICHKDDLIQFVADEIESED